MATFARSHRRGALAALGAALVSGACVTAALADNSPNTFYASAASVATSPCTQAAPCRLDRAVAMANTGDTVVVLPGSYSVSYPVSTSKAITIEGQPGQPRPVLTGTAALPSDVVTASGGATVSHLQIETTSTDKAHPSALNLTGATGQDLILSASAADPQSAALTVQGAATPALVRTVLATSQAPGGEAVLVLDNHAGQRVSLLNLTAIGQGASTAGIVANVPSGTNTLEDSIASGLARDIMLAAGGKGALSVSYSAFRATGSSGFADAGHNTSSAPVFVDAGNGDFHEDAASPTIAAGTVDPAQSATDLDGNAWSAGVGPDMGAYEYVPGAVTSTGGGSTGGSGGSTGSGGGSGGDQGAGNGAGSPPSGFKIVPGEHPLPHPHHPVLGVSVTVHPASGMVGVELPHTHTFVELTAGAQLPVGAVIDAVHGKLVLTSAINRAGATKTGAFTGGAFVVSQSRHGNPLTALSLAGGSFAVCRRATRRATSLTHAPFIRYATSRARPRRRRVVRQLWGSDHGGRFVTIGRSASAAVRGTVWLTQDRCDGTYIHVLRGHVVVYDKARHRHVVIGPGQSYLAPAKH